MRKGVLITFEGPEGSGKSTHIRLLAGCLRRQGRRVLVTREPGGTPWAKALRRILLEGVKPLSPWAELFLYEADRAQHVSEQIAPALRTGKIVLCDRYSDSTAAYQGYARGLDRQAVRTLNTIAEQGCRPDLTILLDVPVQQGLQQAKRKKHRHDRLEKAGLAFHERVRRGFLKLAELEPKRFRVIRQQKTIPITQQLIREQVKEFLYV